MGNVTVVLSGCGVYDGAKINEAVLTLLPGGAHLQCPVSEARVGVTHKLFTTPAYMLAGRESEAYTDNSACVREALAVA